MISLARLEGTNENSNSTYTFTFPLKDVYERASKDSVTVKVDILPIRTIINPISHIVAEHYLKELSPYLIDLAKAGSVAASKANNLVQSVISKLTEVCNLFSFIRDLHGYRKIIQQVQFIKAYLFQTDGQFFNDGSFQAYFYKGKYYIYNYPNVILAENNLANEEYLNNEIRVIATNIHGKNLAYTIFPGTNIEEFMKENELISIVGSSPYFIKNGNVLDKNEFWTQQIGDLRHYIRIPYHPKIGPSILAPLIHFYRNGGQAEIAKAMISKTPITIPLYSDKFSINKDLILEAFRNDPVYNGVEVRIEGDNLYISELKEAVYNHLLFGLTQKGELTLVNISGRNGNITGQNGLTYTEILELCNFLKEKYGIVELFSGCQGRDPDDLTEIYIDENGNLVVSNEYGDNRGITTSPRILLTEL